MHYTNHYMERRKTHNTLQFKTKNKRRAFRKYKIHVCTTRHNWHQFFSIFLKPQRRSWENGCSSLDTHHSWIFFPISFMFFPKDTYIVQISSQEKYNGFNKSCASTVEYSDPKSLRRPPHKWCRTLHLGVLHKYQHMRWHITTLHCHCLSIVYHHCISALPHTIYMYQCTHIGHCMDQTAWWQTPFICCLLFCQCLLLTRFLKATQNFLLRWPLTSDS